MEYLYTFLSLVLVLVFGLFLHLNFFVSDEEFEENETEDKEVLDIDLIQVEGVPLKKERVTRH